MKKITLIFIVLLSFTTFTVAQEFGSNVVGTVTTDKSNAITPFKPDVSVTLGTSFTSFAPGMNAFGTYVMPEITMPVSKKFSVRAGIGYSSTFVSTPENTGNIFSQNNLQYGTVYVSGIYHVNEKLTVAGTAFKTFNLSPKQNEVNPNVFDFSNEGIMINVDYKVSDKFRISAEVSYQKNNPYNYFYNPGGMNMHSSPFQRSPFGSGFGPGF